MEWYAGKWELKHDRGDILVTHQNHPQQTLLLQADGFELHTAHNPHIAFLIPANLDPEVLKVGRLITSSSLSPRSLPSCTVSARAVQLRVLPSCTVRARVATVWQVLELAKGEVAQRSWCLVLSHSKLYHAQVHNKVMSWEHRADPQEAKPTLHASPTSSTNTSDSLLAHSLFAIT